MPYTTGRRGCLAIACVVLAAAAGLGPSTAAAEPSAGSLSTASYANSAGTLAYQLYVPATYQPGVPVPLVVALHGCTQTADKFRTLTGFDDLAAQKGFIVVYPEQSKSANQLNCWNWFQDAHTTRTAGEPTLIAGITNEVQQHYTIDTHRTYVTGLSAGGAMAAVMGATYPDLYAAIGVGSGCEYKAGAACAGYQSLDPQQAGQAAYQAMGAHAREVPFVVFQGDKDTTVPPVNAEQLVKAELVADDWADDGAQNRSVPTTPMGTHYGQVPGGRSYTTTSYSDGHRHELGQYWLVHGMTHAWSGGNPAEQYADATGPNESALMYDFFMGHPAP
jgi:poly(hydroxyalkanoate) depolymerase family esterase